MLLLASCGQEGKSPVVNSTESLQKVGTIVIMLFQAALFFFLSQICPPALNAGHCLSTVCPKCVP